MNTRDELQGRLEEIQRTAESKVYRVNKEIAPLHYGEGNVTGPITKDGEPS